MDHRDAQTNTIYGTVVALSTLDNVVVPRNLRMLVVNTQGQVHTACSRHRKHCSRGSVQAGHKQDSGLV